MASHRGTDNDELDHDRAPDQILDLEWVGSNETRQTRETVETVERSIELDAETDVVWQVLTESADLGHWLGRDVELDLKPGGVGHLTDDEGVRREVLVTDVDAGRRLAWHWWAEGGELSTVEIELVPIESGTAVRVVETMVGAPSGRGPQACASILRLVGRLPAAAFVSCSA